MAGSNFIATWLESNPEWFEDYFVRHGNDTMVQKWREKQGGGKRGGITNTSSARKVTSPGTPKKKEVSSKKVHAGDEKGDIFPIEDSILLPSSRPRSGSRQYLRQDFAKARSKTLFHTWGAPTATLDSLSTLDQNGPISPPCGDPRPGGRRGQLRRASTVPPERHAVNMLSVLLEPKVRLPHRISITNEDKVRLREGGNEREFFLAIVKDISHDLDLNFLKEKIVSNVCILVDGVHCALFLLEGPRGREKLVYKPVVRNNDWNCTSKDDDGVTIQMGETVVGKVAETGRSVIADHPEEDIPYLRDAETVIGFKVDSLMCLPIRNSEDDVIGVALVLNKRSGKMFTDDDERLLETYLTFCGIGISNAQLFDTYMKEYDRNRKLLEVAHDLFEEQTCLDNVVQKIMQRAQSLLKCERCSVMLVKDPNAEEISFSKVFDLPSSLHNGHTNPTKASGDVKLTNGIIEQVALTGDTLNIYDAQKDPRFDKDLDKATPGFKTKSILCMPIRDNKYQIIVRNGKIRERKHIVGVFQILNRTDGFPFDENDESLFEAFTIFCGLGINNTQNYNEVSKAMARQTVALEVLSYHACSSPSEVNAVQEPKLPPEMDKVNLTRFDFDDFALESDDMLRATYRMYINSGLLQKFKIDHDTMCRWLLTVRKNYRPVAYHNFRHAFNVQQAMFALLENTPINKCLSDVEQLTLLVGCLSHDLDHRGTNNAFQEKSQSALATLYGSKATMEYHHFNHAVMILSSPGHNIFAHLNSDQYSEVMNILKHSILATDLALHIKTRGEFYELIKKGKPNWDCQHHKELLRGILMTACDVAASTKPWRIQQKIADLVTSEFFDQGDKERNELNLEPTSMFDRRNQDELPEMQLGFLDGICIPLYEELTKVFKECQPMLDGVKYNRIKWQEQKELRKQQQLQQQHRAIEKNNSRGSLTKPSKLPVSKPIKS